MRPEAWSVQEITFVGVNGVQVLGFGVWRTSTLRVGAWRILPGRPVLRSERFIAMPQSASRGAPALTAPQFYLTGRQPLGAGAILLATLLAVLALCAVLYALGHNRQPLLTSDQGASRSASTPGSPPADDKDDPSQVDTIVLGDAGDAPVPARRGEHVSPVHATIIVHLPRFGEQVGLIPDSAAGRLLYGWLAAFNHASYPELANALPNMEPAKVAAAEMELRQATGGYSLLSAKEVQPGVLVFRLRDQTPLAGEALGTLQMRAGAGPAAIASFSLRVVPGPVRAATTAGDPGR